MMKKGSWMDGWMEDRWMEGQKAKAAHANA